MRPVKVVSSLPALPSATYPSGSLVYLTSNKKVYRAAAVPDEWLLAVDGADITAGTVTAAALAADFVLANLFRTAGSGNRVELQGAGHAFPFWIGSGTKGSASGSPGSGAKVYYDAPADEFVVSGVLKSSRLGYPPSGRVFYGESSSGYNTTIAGVVASTMSLAVLTTSYSAIKNGAVLKHPNNSSTGSNTRLANTKQSIVLLPTFIARHSAAATIYWRIQCSFDGGAWGDLPWVGGTFYHNFTLDDYGGGGGCFPAACTLGTHSWTTSVQFRIEAYSSVAGPYLEHVSLGYYIQNLGDDGSEP
jgi:hypothetical protein